MPQQYKEDAIRKKRWMHLLDTELRGRHVYVSCPYTSDVAEIRQVRVDTVTLLAALLFVEGVHVFSPLTHTVPMESKLIEIGHTGRCLEAYNWLDLDYTFIDKWADRLLILALPGWESSHGIREERYWCKNKFIPIRFVDADDVEVLYHMVQEKGEQARAEV